MGAPRLPPECAARYRAEALIGEGAYGEVWRATQIELDRPVALKVLRAGRSDDPDEVSRFLTEARITAGLSHPGIVICLDYGHEGGYPWIAYEFLPGASLARINARARLGWERVVKAGVQIAEALHHAHERGVLHRDVKPENVIEVEPDRYKVGDFGIAKWTGAGQVRTATGMVIGSPNYLAPEVITGDTATERSDIYALAISLYELLAGTAPFDSANIMDVLQGHIQRNIPRIDEVARDVPAVVADAIHAGLERDPEDRYQTAALFAAALDEAMREPSDPSNPRPRIRTRPAGRSPVSRSVNAGTAVLSTVSQRAGGAPISVVEATPARASLAVRAVLCMAVLALVSLPGLRALRRPGPAPSSAPPVVAPPATGKRPFALAELDWLADRAHVMAYMRCAAPGEAVLTLVDRASGNVLERRALPRDCRVFRHTFANLPPKRDLELRVTPVGPGVTARMRVHTLAEKSTAEVSRDVRNRLLRGVTNTILDEGTRIVASEDDPVDQSTFLVFGMSKFLRVSQRLAERDHQILAIKSVVRLIHDHPRFDLDDIHAACDLVVASHDSAVFDALDQRVRRELPEARALLVRPALACRLTGAQELAEQVLKNPDPRVGFCREAAMTVLARQLPFGPEGARAYAQRIVECPGGVPSYRPLAEELVELDPDVARETFTRWLDPKGRSDLALIALCGLAVLDTEPDRAVLKSVLDGGVRKPVQHTVVMRMLAHVGSPGARALLAGGLRTLPTAGAVWAVARAGGPEARPLLETLLTTGVPEVRLAAAAALGNLGDVAAAPALLAALAGGSRAVRRNAAWALGRLKHAPARDALRAYALSPADETGVGAWALAQLGDRDSGPALVKLHETLLATPLVPGPDARIGVVGWAVRALGMPRPTLGNAPPESMAAELQRLAGRELALQLGPPTASFVHFPFILEQRTGVVVPAGTTVRMIGVGRWGVETQELKDVSDYVFYFNGANVRLGLRHGTQVYTLANWPQHFLTRFSGELSLTSTAINDIHDQSTMGTESLRGAAFVQVAVEYPTP